MIFRIRIKGFKNIKDAEIYLGPFTCFAGPNGVGKSNLFDALSFLRSLSSHENTLFKAASLIRTKEGDKPNGQDIGNLFFQDSNQKSLTIGFELDMVVSATATDYMGQKAFIKQSLLRYEIEIGNDPERKHNNTGLYLRKESLAPLNKAEVRDSLIKMGASDGWLRSVWPVGSKTKPFITTEGKGIVSLAPEGKGSPPKKYNLRSLTRTLVSTASAGEHPTLVGVQQELQGLRILQFEPSSLQASDLLSYSETTQVNSLGGHLPSALKRMDQSDPNVLHRIGNRLFELLEEKVEIKLDENRSDNQLSISLSRNKGPFFPAKSLSDGTLRFLALSTIAEDVDLKGIICLEEPENGIHPLRISPIINLLKDIAFDFDFPIGDENAFRQVLINTHSPSVVSLIPEDALLYVDIEFGSMKIRSLPNTWRNLVEPKQASIRISDLVKYLNPLAESPPTEKKKVFRSVKEAAKIQYSISFDQNH